MLGKSPLSLFAWVVLAGSFLLSSPPAAGEESPPGVLVLAPPGSESPYAGALPELFHRAMDAAGFRYRPVSLPEGLRQNMAHVLSESEGGILSGRVSSYLRSEAREFQIESILLVDAQEADGWIGIRLRGFSSPFDSGWVEAAPRERAPSFPLSLAYLARRTAERLGQSEIRTEAPPVYDGGAEGSFARALATGSLRLLHSAVEKDPSHDLARSELGFRLFLEESRVRAIDHLRAVERDRLPSPFRELHQARLAWATGEGPSFDDAMARLSEVLPGRWETFLLEGAARMEEGKWEEAREMFRQSLRDRPLDPLLHRLLAEASLRDGYLEAAHTEYGRALSLDPEYTLARIGLASTLYSEGRVDEAQRTLDRPAPSDPHTAEGTRPHFLLRAARAGLLTSQGKFRAAAANLAQARTEAYRLGDGESLLDLTVHLFYTLLESGEVDEAAGELSELRYRREEPYWDARAAGLLSYYEGLLGVYRNDFGTLTAKRLELETTARSDPLLPRLLDGQYYLLRGSGWEARGAALRELEWVANRGEYLLDRPLVLSINFFYLGRAFELSRDELKAKMAYGEFLHYWQWADEGRPETLHARNYLRRSE